MPGLRQYISDNMYSWYIHLREKLNWRPFNGDIRVVTGTDKSTAWMQALFVSPDGVSPDDFRVKFTNTRKDGGVRTVYECFGHCLKIMGGPRHNFLDDVRDADNDTSEYCSHTLFVRTLNTTMGDHYWEAFQAGDKSPSAIRTIVRRRLTRISSLWARPVNALGRAAAAMNMLPRRKKTKAIITGYSETLQVSFFQPGE